MHQIFEMPLVKEIFAGAILTLLCTIAVFLYKLPQTLREIQNFLRIMNQRVDVADKRMEEAEKRLDVHDAFWSSHLRTSVNTSMMAKGQMHLNDFIHDTFNRAQKDEI